MSDFLEKLNTKPEFFGVWDETTKSSMFTAIESYFIDDVIREHCITDVVINGDKVLYKWHKRHRPLSDDEFKKKYGR